MARGKYQSAKRVSVKLLTTLLALLLVLGTVAGGTAAWLIAESKEVVNTFTYGDINIDLDETDSDGDGDPDENIYEMIPGEEIAKDPKVTVLADSENCWLFVKLVKSDNFDDFLTYTIGDGWTQLYDAEGNEVEGVYYRFQSETTEDVVMSVLKDDKVVVLEDVTKKMLNALDTDPTAATYPKLTVSAYAVQHAGFEAEIDEGAETPTPALDNAAALKAWNVAQPTETP